MFETDAPLNELEKLVSKSKDREIIQWFRHYLPSCMKLVPYRKRYTKFLEGFEQAIEEGKVNLAD